MPSNKKYKLFAASGEGTKAPCAFFASPSGCRNGDSCKFAHVMPESSSKPLFPTASGSVVSSESEPDTQDGGKLVEVKDESPFLAPSENPHHNESQTKKKNRRGKRSDEHLPFVNPKKKAKTTSSLESVTTTSIPLSSSTAQERQPPAKNKKSSAGVPAPPSFRSLNLPVAPFSLPKSVNDDKSPKKADDELEDSVLLEESSAKETGKHFVAANLPLPKSTKVGRKWLKAVQLTRAHRRYATNYDFDNYKMSDEEGGICGPNGWVKAKLFGTWCADAPPAIAIDCEMCETQDPNSKKKNHSRISVIDTETKDVLLDTLVKPVWPVADYRTWINGIKKEHRTFSSRSDMPRHS